jgi:integrase/recombinase XerC
VVYYNDSRESASTKGLPVTSGELPVGGKTLDEAIGNYLELIQAAGQSSTTIIGARSYLHTFRRYTGPVSLKDAASQAIPFMAWRRERVKRNTLSSQYSYLHSLFAMCVRRGHVRLNPLDEIAKPRAEQVVTQSLTDDELERLLAAGNELDRAMILLLLGSGMRIGELSALCWSDISGDQMVVHGKGDKDRVLAPGRVAMAAIRRLPRDGDAVFPITYGSIRNRLARLAKRAQVAFHPHKMRHAFSRRFIRSGGSVLELYALLGHADINTTMVYLRANQREDALDAQRKHNPCDALFGGDDDGGGKIIPLRRR